MFEIVDEVQIEQAGQSDCFSMSGSSPEHYVTRSFVNRNRVYNPMKERFCLLVADCISQKAVDFFLNKSFTDDKENSTVQTVNRPWKRYHKCQEFLLARILDHVIG